MHETSSLWWVKYSVFVLFLTNPPTTFHQSMRQMMMSNMKASRYSTLSLRVFRRGEIEALVRIYRKLVSNCKVTTRAATSGSSVIAKPHSTVEVSRELIWEEGELSNWLTNGISYIKEGRTFNISCPLNWLPELTLTSFLNWFTLQFDQFKITVLSNVHVLLVIHLLPSLWCSFANH